MADQQKKTFFQKHPGIDAYSLFWLVVFGLFLVLGRFYLPLLIPAAIALVYLLFRLLSRNSEKRQVENARFLALVRSIVRWFKRRKKTLQPDKEHYYFKCPNCGLSMRVPKGLGKVEITCKACATRFETKS